MSSSGIWRHVDLVWNDVKEKHTASFFRVEKSASEEPASAGVCSLQYVTPKRRLTQYLHGATSQKTTFFIVISVETLNLTYSVCLISKDTIVDLVIRIPPASAYWLITHHRHYVVPFLTAHLKNKQNLGNPKRRMNLWHMFFHQCFHLPTRLVNY
jgi:hypothetical protein